MKKTLIFVIAFSLILSVYAFGANPVGVIFTEELELLNQLNRCTVSWDSDEEAAKFTMDRNHSDPWLRIGEGGTVEIDSSKVNYLRYEYKLDVSAVQTESDVYKTEIFWNYVDNDNWGGAGTTSVELSNDGEWHTEVIDMSQFDSWATDEDTIIKAIRLDPLDNAKDDAGMFDAVVYYKHFLFFETEEEANSYGQTVEPPETEEPVTENPRTNDIMFSTVFMSVVALSAVAVVLRKRKITY